MLTHTHLFHQSTELSLDHHHRLALGRLPNVLQIVDALYHTQSQYAHIADRRRTWHHLYTSSGGGSVSAGLTQFGNRCRLSASYLCAHARDQRQRNTLATLLTKGIDRDRHQ
jgi:hypothetical protein